MEFTLKKTEWADAQIKNIATHFNLDWKWLEAIIAHESSWNSFAMRYEKDYPYLYQVDVCAKLSGMSIDTEVVTQKMSWGLAQIMGALAREHGFHGPLSQLTDPATNILHLGIRLSYLVRLNPSKDAVFAMYNGGPGVKKLPDGKYANQAYVDAVNAIWINLS